MKTALSIIYLLLAFGVGSGDANFISRHCPENINIGGSVIRGVLWPLVVSIRVMDADVNSCPSAKPTSWVP